MVHLKTKPLEGILTCILEFFDISDPLEPRKLRVKKQWLGGEGMSFLKFVAEKQTFPGPKTNYLQDAPLDRKPVSIGLGPQVWSCP